MSNVVAWVNGRWYVFREISIVNEINFKMGDNHE